MRKLRDWRDLFPAAVLASTPLFIVACIVTAAAPQASQDWVASVAFGVVGIILIGGVLGCAVGAAIHGAGGHDYPDRLD